MQNEWVFPSVTCRWEGPDTFVSRITNSELDLDSSHGMISLVPDLFERTRYLFWLFDIGAWDATTPEVRDYFRNLNVPPVRFSFLINGGTFLSRTSISMGLRALTLMGRANIEPLMMRDESEARAWLAANRGKQRRLS